MHNNCIIIGAVSFTIKLFDYYHKTRVAITSGLSDYDISEQAGRQ